MNAPARKKYESARQRARQANILEVTRDMLAEVGYAKTTIRGLAVRAGVAPGTLYNLYASKDALIMAAVEDLLVNLMVDASNESMPGVPRILAMAEHSAATIQNAPAYAEAMTRALFGPGEGASLSGVLYSGNIPILKQQLDHAVGEGDLRAGIDTQMIAEHMQSQGWALVMSWLMGVVQLEHIVNEFRRSRLVLLAAYATGQFEAKYTDELAGLGIRSLD